MGRGAGDNTLLGSMSTVGIISHGSSPKTSQHKNSISFASFLTVFLVKSRSSINATNYLAALANKVAVNYMWLF